MRISDWSSDVCSSDLAMDDIQEWLALINSWEPKLRLEVLGASRSLDTVPLPESAFQRVERSFGTLAEPARLVASALAVFTVQIGRAACLERVCQYVHISVVAGSLNKKIKKIHP